MGEISQLPDQTGNQVQCYAKLESIGRHHRSKSSPVSQLSWQSAECFCVQKYFIRIQWLRDSKTISMQRIAVAWIVLIILQVWSVDCRCSSWLKFGGEIQFDMSCDLISEFWAQNIRSPHTYLISFIFLWLLCLSFSDRQPATPARTLKTKRKWVLVPVCVFRGDPVPHASKEKTNPPSAL